MELHAIDCTQHKNVTDEDETKLKDLSAQSSDLNIIEQIGTELKRRVRQKNPGNFRE